MITRRGLLAGILGAGIAPAIVHNPMRLWVPKQELASSGDWYGFMLRRGGPLGGDLISLEQYMREFERVMSDYLADVIGGPQLFDSVEIGRDSSGRAIIAPRQIQQRAKFHA